MTIKKVLLIMLILSFSECIHAQKDKSVLSSSTSNTLRIVSYFWKLDSFANNGFRLYAYDRVLASKIDTVSINYLIDKLGKPNQISNTNQGVIYVYYYLDSAKMPKKFGKPFECGYIDFMFDEKTKLLTSMSKGVMDY
jgi:hypothetical protein